MRVEDIPYAAAAAILLAWLIVSVGTTASQSDRSALASPAPGSTPAALSESEPPRVAAELTVDSERFYILVGDGPPTFGVAVSAPD